MQQSQQQQQENKLSLLDTISLASSPLPPVKGALLLQGPLSPQPPSAAPASSPLFPVAASVPTVSLSLSAGTNSLLPPVSSSSSSLCLSVPLSSATPSPSPASASASASSSSVVSKRSSTSISHSTSSSFSSSSSSAAASSSFAAAVPFPPLPLPPSSAASQGSPAAAVVAGPSIFALKRLHARRSHKIQV